MTQPNSGFSSDDEDAEVGEAGELARDEQVFLVGEDDESKRLDVFLSERMPDISRSQLQRLIAIGAVQINGSPAKASVRTQHGDLLLVEVPAPKASHILAEDIPLDIVFEDGDIIVINKAKGMVVHPAPGSEDGTLVNALLAHAAGDLSGIGGIERPGIVHRLDKDTTGLLVVAKNDVAHNGLQQQIQKKTATRKYLALIWGHPPFQEAVVDAPIGRHPGDRKRMTVTDAGSRTVGRMAVTELRVQEVLGPCTLLEATLQTGRTHQIRVHCAFAGFPIVGDAQYGGIRKVSAEHLRGPQAAEFNHRVSALHGQCLHAYSLSLDHPRTGERLSFTAPLPGEMRGLIEFLQALQTPESAPE
ncbi:MAG: RluA family pseudouridine synthase [Cytophagales bacterium]|nr:RluA family pseudouridine synthase [Armatimonadota bacterium]